jgi:hypothetical protein
MASDFGSGLGGIIGGAMASDDLARASNTEDSLANSGMAMQQPYQNFGASFLQPTQTIAGSDATVGGGRFMNGANNVQSYNDFMQNYQTSPAAQYAIGQGTEAVNNSAAARGKLLSGGTERELSTMQQGIASQFANQAYGEYLQGNQQQFGQLETALGNLFQGIGVGQTSTGQQSGVLQSNMNAQASIAGAQAKADQGIGGGIGSMFSGLAGLAAK